MKNLKILIIFSLFASLPVLANESEDISERERLESVISELGYLQGYLERSQSSQKSNRRSRFDYMSSIQRIELLKFDIQTYLSDPTHQPKFGFEPSLNLGR